MRVDGAEELVRAALLVDERQVLLEHLRETRRPQLELRVEVLHLAPPSALSRMDLLTEKEKKN